MPRGKKTQLTPKQQEVRDLLKAQPNMSVEEIAKLLETSKGAIYQHMKRLRGLGELPSKGAPAKAARVKTTARKAARKQAETDFERTIPPPKALTIEQHVERELKTVEARREQITADQQRLATEANELTTREARLVKARDALAPPVQPPATATVQESPAAEYAPASELAAAAA